MSQLGEVDAKKSSIVVGVNPARFVSNFCSISTKKTEFITQELRSFANIK